MLEQALAGLILLAVVVYAVLGGADFGGGVWDLFASGPRKEAQREAIAEAMGPVWEANHVWLIFVIVLLFTGFPPAFALLSLTLFLPFHLVLVGIILRGAAFVFRAYGPRMGPHERQWGRVFGVASLLTPLVLGMILGAVSSETLDWLAPEAVATGLLAVAACAYLAATYLTIETEGDLRDDFRRRALAAWAAVGALALVTLPLLRIYAPHLWENLAGARGAPVLAAGALTAGVALWALLARRFLVARAFAAAQVAVLLLGWALLQYPYVVFPALTLQDAAAPDAVLAFTLVTSAVGMLVLIPSLALLFRVFKGQRPGVGRT